MLPPDFHWRSVASRPDGKDDSVFCDGTQVLRLSQRINDGGWYASLNTQRPERGRWTTRECTSYEHGVAGAELWVVRHQDRLRAEIDRLRVERIGARLRNA
ncbi:MAG TPA: hypothetical protein DEO93_03840 [Stenotrophomonas sp.]|nr:hypothetical protein [Stenotrophomonas sp.]